MTDRYKGVVVTFDHDIRDDDAEETLNAIRHIRGVLDVRPVVANHDDHMNRELVRQELMKRLWDVLRSDKP